VSDSAPAKAATTRAPAAATAATTRAFAPANAVTRRSFIGRSAGSVLAVGGTAAFLAACGGTSSGSGDEVVVLTFVSYADKDIKRIWRETNPDLTMRAVPAADDSELLTKLKAGGADAYDVVWCDFGYAPAFHATGLIEVLDLNEIPAAHDLYPEFREEVDSFPYLVAPNKAIGFPGQWAATSLTYNTQVDYQPSEPYSWNALWDPAVPDNAAGFQGTAPDGIIATAGLAKGFSSREVYELAGSDLRGVVDYLKELKPFRVVESDPEMRDAIRREEVWLGLTSTTGFADKINEEAGKDVSRSVVPDEGSLGFIDGPMLVKNAKNRKNALKYIDWFMTNEKLRDYVFEAYRAAPCSKKTAERLDAKGGETAKLLQTLRGTEPDIAAKITQVQAPKDPKAYAGAWDEINS
jgi:spermidine/putrescine transport system substrate-binding protein